jgi:hypothetical protein
MEVPGTRQKQVADQDLYLCRVVKVVLQVMVSVSEAFIFVNFIIWA